MEQKNLVERCDVFMNENEIRPEVRIELGKLKKFQVPNQKMMIQCN
jgi:hypothetical protein